MSADVYIVGRATGPVTVGEGNRPDKFRIAADTGFGEAKKSVFFGVSAWLDPTDVDRIDKGTPVTVVGRLEQWKTKDDNTVTDVVANDVSVGVRYRQRNGNGGGSARSTSRRSSRDDSDI